MPTFEINRTGSFCVIQESLDIGVGVHRYAGGFRCKFAKVQVTLLYASGNCFCCELQKKTILA